MLCLDITQDMINRAKIKADDLGVLNNSIRKGNGNFIGFLGEELVAEYLKVPTCNTYDYDLVYNGLKIDVKTKECTSPPKEYYECSVSAANTKQKCNWYIFVRILKDHSKGWICGGMEKNDYFKKAVFHKLGEKDDSNNFTFKWDCYNISISELDNIYI